jgi:glycosyltransferase involved in cell wall biosynthesis
MLQGRNTAATRVAHVIAPAFVGGAESVVRSLAMGAPGAGLAAEVVALVQLEGAHPYVERLRRAGLAVAEIRCGRRRYRKEARAVAARLVESGAALVHTHGYHADLVGLWAARRCRLPAVTTVHGFTGGDWKNLLYEWLQRRAVRRFDAVIAVSTALAHALAGRGVPGYRLHVIPNGWLGGAARLSRTEARRALGVSEGGFRVGWIGRVSREKGADVLLAALGELTGEGVEASIVGDGPERRRLEARWGALRVSWHGEVPEAGSLVPAFDILVLSSRSEGTPMVLFEAMAAGVPVVATRVGGVPDVVSAREAWLVDSESPAALAAAIRALRADPAGAAALAAAARRRLLSDFAPGPWLARHAELYRQLIARRRI